MTASALFASRLLRSHGNRVHIADLDAREHELFDRALAEQDKETVGDWFCEGAISFYCDRGSVLVVGSNVI